MGTGSGTYQSMRCGGIGVRTLFQVAYTPFIICAIHILIYIVQCVSLTSLRCMCIYKLVHIKICVSLSVQVKTRGR